MLTSEDVKRVVRRPADLEKRIEQLEKQKKILQFSCKKAGTRIKELERDREVLKKENDRLFEENNNLEIIMKGK
jgi:predicted RNase H-like nuclease (RuvC/YqgF family)